MRHRLLSTTMVGGVILLAGILLSLAGCSKSEPLGTVQGKVTLNGQSYSNARLNFLGKGTGAASAAEIESNGAFRVETPMKVGTYTVFLAPKTTADPDHPSPSPGIDPKVPATCWNEATSLVKIEVKAGQNEVPIELAK